MSILSRCKHGGAALLAASVALLVACGGGGGRAGNAQPMSVTKTIGAGGGVIDGLNGVVLTVPPRALSADVPITIAVNASGAPAFPASAPQIGPAVSITPHGTSFGVPVTISVPFDTTQLPAGEQPLLVKTNPRGDGWQQLAVVREGDRLTAAVTSFSWIGVRCCIDTVHIIDQPDDQTAFEGGFAFFRVEALRYEEVRYQWFRNGLAMRGETNQELLIARVNLAHDNSLYMARVTNVLGGFEDSRAARLLVNPIAPVIVNQPLDAQVIAGDPATFNAASTSSVVQTLQWERCNPDCRGDVIPNETGTALSVAAQEGDDGKRFRMCATNAGGKTCSRAALLTVIPRPVQPAIVQQPQSLTVPAEMSASFSVQATGGSLSYRWEHAPRGGGFVAHPDCGDAATCTLSNTSLGDDGTAFRVLVSNNAGSVLSDDALLTVRLNPGAALVRLQGGNRHSIALRADATLLAWGANGDGQLGDGTFDARSDAVAVGALADAATFALGADHAIALRANGEVWTWGANDRGQLGDGSTTPRATPQRVAGIGPARAAAANNVAMSRSTVVLVDGNVWSWGSNLHGQLGDGTIVDQLAPVRAGTLTDIVRVAAGLGYTLALRSDGTVWAWGDNRGGQLGDGTTTGSVVPIPAPMPAPIVAIAATGSASYALTDEGAVLAWGPNRQGQLGDGTTTDRLTPTALSLPAPAIAIAAGGVHALALLLDGRVYAWGWNADGQCGCGSNDEVQAVPRRVIGLPAITAIGAGLNHSLALAADGSVWAWGDNSAGQLNDGSTNDRAAPVRVRNVNLN